MHDALTFNILQEQRGVVVYEVGSMVSALQKQVRRHHQTQAMSRAAGQTGSTGMPARVRLGLASERANRTHARIVASPTRHKSHNSIPASILEAKLLL